VLPSQRPLAGEALLGLELREAVASLAISLNMSTAGGERLELEPRVAVLLASSGAAG
jgi:hypothetical protein